MSIKLHITPEEKQNLLPGRYYILVRVKVPQVILMSPENEGSIEPRLDPNNSYAHTDPRVLHSTLFEVVVDLTDHPDCPQTHSVATADAWLAKHFYELDAALRLRL